MSEGLLKFYKRWISAMFPPACRYVPTCSEYGAEAVARYGIFRGGAMAAWRFARCNPFTRGGWDPVCRSSHPIAPNAVAIWMGQPANEQMNK